MLSTTTGLPEVVRLGGGRTVRTGWANVTTSIRCLRLRQHPGEVSGSGPQNEALMSRVI